MDVARYFDELPTEDSLRDELADTLKKADAIRELIKVVRRQSKKRNQQDTASES